MSSELSNLDKQHIRIGYRRLHKRYMSESEFDALSSDELEVLRANGARRITFKEKLHELFIEDYKEKIFGFVILAIILGFVGYSIITLKIMGEDYDKIAEVQACDLFTGLDLPVILPDQAVSIEKTGNKLGAASDCWVHLDSGDVRVTATVYVHAEYSKVKSNSSLQAGDWRGRSAWEYSFEENFYRGDVTAFQTKPKDADSQDLLIKTAQTLLASEVGKTVVRNLPSNQNVDNVRRGFVWGWLVPTFFDTTVEGTPPKGPEDSNS